MQTTVGFSMADQIVAGLEILGEVAPRGLCPKHDDARAIVCGSGFSAPWLLELDLANLAVWHGALPSLPRS